MYLLFCSTRCWTWGFTHRSSLALSYILSTLSLNFWQNRPSKANCSETSLQNFMKNVGAWTLSQAYWISSLDWGPVFHKHHKQWWWCASKCSLTFLIHPTTQNHDECEGHFPLSTCNNLELPGKGVSMRDCLHEVGLGVYLWGLIWVALIVSGKTSPLWVAPFPGHETPIILEWRKWTER